MTDDSASIDGQQGGTLGVPCRFKFTGSAMELFKELFVGYLLTIITLGIYTPWFICRAQRWFWRNVSVRDDAGKEVKLQFVGTGGDLFGTFIVGCILTVITFGIYGFWFIVKLHKFFLENTTGQTPDGQPVKLAFNATGGELFKELFVGYLLTIITLGIYSPWMICSLQRFFSDKTKIHVGSSGQVSLRFLGTGGDLFVTFLVGYLLTCVTLGIYMFWFQVKIMKFISENTEITTVSGNKLRLNFTGTGGENAKINIVGILLTILTLGLYSFRFTIRLIEFQTNHLEITSAGPGTPGGTIVQP